MAVEITEEQIRPLLDLDEVRGAVEDALRLFSEGKATQPVRTMVNVQDHGGFLGATPSYAGALGLKIITFYPNNANSRPYTGILMFNPRDGRLRATIEASSVGSQTAARAAPPAWRISATTRSASPISSWAATTRAPARARVLAIASASPEPAPVTRAVLPLRPNASLSAPAMSVMNVSRFVLGGPPP